MIQKFMKLFLPLMYIKKRDLLGMDVDCCCGLAPMASGGTCGCGWFNIIGEITCGRGLGAIQALMGGVLVPPVTLSDGRMFLKYI